MRQTASLTTRSTPQTTSHSPFARYSTAKRPRDGPTVLEPMLSVPYAPQGALLLLSALLP
jgi:hypothetical protein